LKPFQVNVSSKYGAPMGRPGQDLKIVAAKLHLERVPFVDSCYDQGGAYWGSPANLYCAWGEADGETIAYYLRANSRQQAKAKLQELFPDLKFYR
jgi:hypothetical protein